MYSSKELKYIKEKNKKQIRIDKEYLLYKK